MFSAVIVGCFIARVDRGPAVLVDLPVAIVFYRRATERVVADPTAEEG